METSVQNTSGNTWTAVYTADANDGRLNNLIYHLEIVLVTGTAITAKWNQCHNRYNGAYPQQCILFNNRPLR